LEPEPADDPMDQFAVTMLADQGMDTWSFVDQRHHELPPMPKCDDEVPA